MASSRKRSTGDKAATRSAGLRGADLSADRLAERAKADGGAGPYGSAAERALRDAAVIARLTLGWTQAEVAREFGISERTIRAIRDRAGRSRSPLDEAPVALVEDLLRALRQLYADLVALAFKYEDRNPPSAIGALKQSRECLADLVSLLRAVGKLPDNLGVFALERDLLHLGDVVLIELEKVASGETTAAEAVEFVRAVVAARGEVP
jgi:transposase-like protein